MTESWIRFLVENYYDLQKLRVETFNRLVAYVKVNWSKLSQAYFESQTIDASHLESENHLHIASVGQYSDFAKQLTKEKISIPKEIQELVWYHNMLYDTEKQLAKRLDRWSKTQPIRIEYLSKIKGIGPILSSGLIAWLSPIERFPNISKLWAYCGLAPNQKRQKGKKLGYNPRLKTFMWKIASSFEKQNAKTSRYRRIYTEKKNEYLNREDLQKAIKQKVKGAKLHVRLMAMRYTEKRFLADLWIVWRKLENLPVTEPYSIVVQGHTGFVEPKTD